MAGRRRYLVNFCTMVQVRNYFFDYELDLFYQGIRLARKIISPVSLVVFYVIPQPLHQVFPFRCPIFKLIFILELKKVASRVFLTRFQFWKSEGKSASCH